MVTLWNGLLLRIAKHWIAGETYEEAISRAERSNTHKVHGIINLLGEDITNPEQTTAAATEYAQILKTISERRIHCSISIKPTQLGIGIDEGLFTTNLESILTTATQLDNSVWVDMESSSYTAKTVDLYLDFRRRFENIGVAIQAYGRRSEEDLNRVLDAKGSVRLCKGAYNENTQTVYKNRKEIRNNFSKLMLRLFERGRGFAIATHDEKLIHEAIELSRTHHTDFEFEMLMGIRDQKKIELAEQGYRVAEYIPYGKSWKAYSVRRITEHKSNILLLGRSLLSN